MTVAALLLTALAFLLAGFVKGVIGLGLPTVAIGLLSLVMTPAQAAALLVVPSLVTNVWQLALGAHLLALLRRLWPLLLGICAGTAIGALAFPGAMTGRATAALGLALIVYAGLGLAAVRFEVPPRAEPFLSPLIGIATGIVTAATGVFVLPGVPYIHALGFDRDDLVQALGISFTVSTLALAAMLARDGALQLSVAVPSLLALVVALAGMALGQWVRRRVRPEVFRTCFFLGLLLLGGHLALRAVY